MGEGLNMNVLIGHTGFIGSSLNQDYFDVRISSKDWNTISNNSISADDAVITAPSGLKWKANQDPEKDLQNIKELVYNIKNKFKSIRKLILVSSNDAILLTSEYGKNRKYFNDLLEKYCFENNIELYIFYLGMTFGKNAKKGMVFDFLNGNFDYYKGGVYQLYPVSRLFDDIRYCVKNNIQRALFCSEPIETSEVKALFGITENSLSDVSYKVEPFGIPAIKKSEIFDCINELKKSCYNI